jgi:hypothetical protein
MFLKNVVLHEIYSKKSQLPDTFGTSLYVCHPYIDQDEVACAFDTRVNRPYLPIYCYTSIILIYTLFYYYYYHHFTFILSKGAYIR